MKSKIKEVGYLDKVFLAAEKLDGFVDVSDLRWNFDAYEDCFASLSHFN